MAKGLCFTLHLLSTLRNDPTGGPSLGQFDALGFSWRVVARMLIQAVVLVIVSVAANQSMLLPDLDRLWADAEQRGHFLYGQHARLTKSIIARREAVISLNARDDSNGKRLSLARAHAAFVQYGGEAVRIVVGKIAIRQRQDDNGRVLLTLPSLIKAEECHPSADTLQFARGEAFA
jgi:hypothetical protein